MFASVGCGASLEMRTIILKGVFLMKKTLFALFAVLLVLFLVSCEDFMPPSSSTGDNPGFTEDGRPMVQLTIDVGNGAPGRSILPGNASSDSNQYEVAFLHSSGIYRKRWTSGNTSITIPADDYTGVGAAVVFAGNSSTLLAIGRISDVDGTSVGVGGTATIDPATSKITFTMEKLESVVDNTPASSLQISTDGGTTWSGATSYTTGTPAGVPVFGVGNGSNILGNWAFKLNPTSNNYAGVQVKGSWTLSSTYDSAINSSGAIPPLGSITATTSVMMNGNFSFSINLGTFSNKYSKIYIDVPVVPINNSPGESIAGNSTSIGDWNIRGGLNNDTLDNGVNKGGAVLLRVGTPLEFADVEIEGTP